MRAPSALWLLLSLLATAGTLVAEPVADTPAVQPLGELAELGGGAPEVLTAQRVLDGQPTPIVDRLMDERVVVLAEVRREGPLSGGLITSYVIFDVPIDQAWALLSRSDRQIEFRPELSSIETVEESEGGVVDEHRMKILFSRYVYRIAYRLDPERYRIEWELDERFDNDLESVNGFWEFYEMPDGRTLGRAGNSVDVGPQVPGFLQDWITRKNIPKTMERVRLWVDSGGSYRP